MLLLPGPQEISRAQTQDIQGASSIASLTKHVVARRMVYIVEPPSIARQPQFRVLSIVWEIQPLAVMESFMAEHQP